MGINIRGAYKKMGYPIPVSHMPLLSFSSVRLNHRIRHKSPGLYLLGPVHLVPCCAHLASYSAGSLEVICLCICTRYSLAQQPFLIFLNSFSWVLLRQS